MVTAQVLIVAAYEVRGGSLPPYRAVRSRDTERSAYLARVVLHGVGYGKVCRTRFAHQPLAQRVVFAPGEAVRAVTDGVTRLGTRRVMMIASPSSTALAGTLRDGPPVAPVHDEVVDMCPSRWPSEPARPRWSCGADFLLCVGGGAATGMAMAVGQRDGERPPVRHAFVPVNTETGPTSATKRWLDWSDGLERIAMLLLQAATARGPAGPEQADPLFEVGPGSPYVLLDNTEAPCR